jgi:hypothetical protein
MDKHRKIIGWVFFGWGFFLCLVLLLSWRNTPSLEVTAQLRSMYWGGIAGGLLYCAAGYLLLANSARASWVCLPVAVLSLFAFPIGTAMGAYYIWYFWQLRYAQT